MKYLMPVVFALSLLNMSCEENEKTDELILETHKVSFKNLTSVSIEIKDNTGSVEPLFGKFNIAPYESQSLSYQCLECASFDFWYEVINNIYNIKTCICLEGEEDFTIGKCPGVNNNEHCLECVNNSIGSNPNPCNN